MKPYRASLEMRVVIGADLNGHVGAGNRGDEEAMGRVNHGGVGGKGGECGCREEGKIQC